MLAANGQGLLLCWYYIFVQPGLKPNLLTDDKIKYKSSMEFRSPELQADKGTTDDV